MTNLLSLRATIFKIHGSGLGLYILKETLTKLEGGTEIDTQIGEGTIFKVSLPKKLGGPTV